MNLSPSPLDNPAHNSLVEAHQNFAIGNNELKLYRPNVCTFGGIKMEDNPSDIFDPYILPGQPFFIIGKKPNLPAHIVLEKEIVCLQMVCAVPVKMAFTEKIILLKKEHHGVLFELINLVQPGYFQKETPLMGDYFGIFKNGQLVAVAGERMRMFDYTEISAVVTRPGFTGKGFAKQLVAHTVNKNFAENKIPYLHVVESNVGAIKLYHKLGFATRRKISFWKLKRTPV
ncbi:MAG: GNAT family N-acetyltransferase [Bacteroidota bacterium]